MQKRIKIFISLLCFISLQYVLLEYFERSYYKIEENFTVGLLNHVGLKNNQAEKLKNLYQYDRYGLRTHHIDYENKKGYRVLLVGGNSIVMGFSVPIEQSLAYYLQKKLEARYPEKHIEVINACLPGHPLPKNMAHLKNIFFDKIKPDLVLYTAYLYETDLFFSGKNPLTTESIFSHDTDLFNEPQGTHLDIKSFKTFRLDQTKVGKLLVENSLLAAKLIAYVDQNLNKKKNKLKNKMLRNKIHCVVSGYVEELNNYLASHHIQFMVIELPRSKKNLLSQEIRTLASFKSIPYLSLKEKWDENSLSYIENGHYSALTNKQVGEEIGDWVAIK